MKRIKYLIALLLLAASCQEKSNTIDDDIAKNIETSKEPKAETKKYLYQDMSGCCHIDGGCIAFMLIDSSPSSMEAIAIEYSRHRIPIDSIVIKDIYWCCNKCIDNASYDSLYSICLQNQSNEINTPPSRRGNLLPIDY